MAFISIRIKAVDMHYFFETNRFDVLSMSNYLNFKYSLGRRNNETIWQEVTAGFHPQL